MEDRMELVPLEGAGPPTSADLSEISARLNERLAQQGAEMRNLLEAEEQVITFLEGQLAHHHDRAKRIRRALGALEGETPKPAAAKAKQKNNHDWDISDAKVEEVYAAIVKAIEASDNGTTTMTVAREQAGSSASETYRKAVDKLRAQERIRVAGKTRGGGTLLALMPEATAHAA